MTTIGEQPFISSLDDRLLIEDDTEESVSGSDFHLAAILALYEVLRRYAQRTLQRWYVTAEVMVLVDVPDRVRNPWTPMPDVYVVLDTPGDPRVSLDTRADASFPQFICEVASDSTWKRDVGEKQRVYADLGVQEYIVFDPRAEFLGGQVRAWRRQADGTWGAWTPDAEGFLHSDVLGLRLRAEGPLLRVYDPEEGRLPTGQELARMVQEATRAIEVERRAREEIARSLQVERRAREQSDALARERADALAQEQARRAELEEELARLRTRMQADGQGGGQTG